VSRHEEGLREADEPLRAAARLRAFLLVALLVQIGILAFQEPVFFGQMFGRASRAGVPGTAPAGSSAVLALSVVAVSVLWALRGGAGSVSGRFGQAGLVQLAALGLALYAAGLAADRFLRVLAAPLVLVSGLLAIALPDRAARKARPFVLSRLGPWDALTGLLLATLAVPTVYPYIHFDAAVLWACRSLGFADRGFFGALGACLHQNYPPLFSILLGLGAGDPLFEGRLLAWLLVVFFAFFLRDRFAVVSPAFAPAALLFVLATVHVWQGAAMYYANVPLMAFLTAGALLVLGLPGTGAAPSRGDLLAGTACLSAAVLVRPDGLYYMVALFAALLWHGFRGGPRVPVAPFGAAGAVALSWSLRPAFLKAADDFFTHASGGWRALAPTAPEGVRIVLGDFLFAWQGQWLSHKGLGATLYALGAVAVAGRFVPVREGAGGERALYARVTLASLAAVVVCFLLLPFVGDPVQGAQPHTTTDFRACFQNVLNVGFGRMTVHLLPFYVLWGLAVLRDGAAPDGRRGAGNIV
jgi:hypothetical protein